MIINAFVGHISDLSIILKVVTIFTLIICVVFSHISYLNKLDLGVTFGLCLNERGRFLRRAQRHKIRDFLRYMNMLPGNSIVASA